MATPPTPTSTALPLRRDLPPAEPPRRDPGRHPVTDTPTRTGQAPQRVNLWLIDQHSTKGARV